MECTAIIRRSGDWWIGWVAEVPGVNCQERTLEELRVSIAEAVEFNRRDARQAAEGDYFEEKVAVA